MALENFTKFPHLPVELQLIIFEHATAQASHNRMEPSSPKDALHEDGCIYWIWPSDSVPPYTTGKLSVSSSIVSVRILEYGHK